MCRLGSINDEPHPPIGNREKLDPFLLGGIAQAKWKAFDGRKRSVFGNRIDKFKGDAVLSVPCIDSSAGYYFRRGLFDVGAWKANRVNAFSWNQRETGEPNVLP